MKTVTIENGIGYGLFRQVMTPDEQRNSILIPKEWYGMRVEVILFPVAPDTETDFSPSPLPNAIPFKVNRRRLKSMRVSSVPELLSDNLIRADRDAR